MIELSIKPILLFWSFVIPAWLIYRMLRRMFYKQCLKAPTAKHELLLFVLVIYGTAVLAITVAPGSMHGFNQPQGPTVNIIPVFHTFHNFMNAASAPDNEAIIDSLENIIGNLLLFTPLGILVPLIFTRINSFKIIAVVFVIASASIEMIQLLLRRYGTYRTADIDDVILNTAGGIIGWLTYVNYLKGNGSKVRSATAKVQVK